MRAGQPWHPCGAPPILTTRSRAPVLASVCRRSVVNLACTSTSATTDRLPHALSSRPRLQRRHCRGGTARATQTSRIRTSATRPGRSTRIAIETLSIEWRLTAESQWHRVVSGFEDDLAREASDGGRKRGDECAGMARDDCITGQDDDGSAADLRCLTRPHLPRAGRGVLKPRPPVGTRPGFPTRLVRRVGARRARHSSRPPRPCGGESARRRGLRRQAPSQASERPRGHPGGGQRPPWCSAVCDACQEA